VQCVTDNAPPPAELRLAWMCERWNSLPTGDGLYMQEYRTMYLMGALLNVYGAVWRVKHLPPKQIHSLTENERRILGNLRDLGLLFKA
jgi:hypothetical protein